ncbi:MAG: 3-phosphoshikimate 1-carboxyvinyltransferase [Elusimicrobiota bacterium]|nr:MAG: 3-phosphoshikimate 1-carboxyvinyltransferase [Elusimicrobiota bacterium]
MSDRAVAGGGRLAGEIRVPGDKSVSHRALILGALADGETAVEGLSSGADVASTRRCLEALGVEIAGAGPAVRVTGRGLGGLAAPKGDLDAGNSGTTMRLLAGVVAGHPFPARFTGDASLTRRPMRRIAEPLRAMGAAVTLSDGDTAPLSVAGGPLKGVEYAMKVASAQVKSCVLLAGLHAAGETTVAEPAQTRDHTERMLAGFGVSVRRAGLKVTVAGGSRLRAAKVIVPGDPSSAAFWAVAATLSPGSELAIRGVGANPTRTGYLNVLARMGADIHREPLRGDGGEPIEDLLISSSELRGTEISADEIPGLVDEVPVLALAAALARGSSRFRGLSELRHKESDRLAGIAALLNAFGAVARVEGDDLLVEGVAALAPGRADALDDHRLAMTAFVAAFLAGGESEIGGLESAAISYPSFYDDFRARTA